MSSENASNSHGLCPVNGQKPSLDTQTGSKISSQACLWASPRLVVIVVLVVMVVVVLVVAAAVVVVVVVVIWS